MPIPMIDTPEILDRPSGDRPGHTLRDSARDEIIPGLAARAAHFDGAHAFVTKLCGAPDTFNWGGSAAEAHMLLILHIGALNPGWTFRQVAAHAAHLISSADPDAG